MTSTKTKLITKTQAVREIKRIVAENPDRVNPKSDNNARGYCLYHKGRGRNRTRCLIGQLGYELGLPTPEADAGSAFWLMGPGGKWDGLFVPAAVEYLDNLQMVADGGFFGKPIPWGKIPKSVINGCA